jgi:hypothetical protein
MRLARLFRSPTRKSPPARRLSVECLEDRTTPSGGGLLDPTFGAGGVVLSHTTAPAPGSNGWRGLQDVTVQPDGKILAAAFVNGDFGAVRYNPDGSLDPAYDPDTGAVKNGATPSAQSFVPDAGHVYATALELSGISKANQTGKNNRPALTFVKK